MGYRLLGVAVWRVWQMRGRRDRMKRRFIASGVLAIVLSGAVVAGRNRAVE